MPEGLTQTKTPTSKNPAGFQSECRPVSFRNRGRLQIGTMAGFKSEYPAGINRNPHSLVFPGLDSLMASAWYQLPLQSARLKADSANLVTVLVSQSRRPH